VAIVGAVTGLLSPAFFDRRDACAMSVFSNAERYLGVSVGGLSTRDGSRWLVSFACR